MGSTAQECPSCHEQISQEARYCHHCGLPIKRTAPTEGQQFDLEKFFELALDMLCIAGMDGYFKRVNPAFQRILGYSADELLGQPFVDLIHPDDRTETLREVSKLTEGSPTLAFENRYRCKDGTYRNLYWTSFPDPGTGLLYAIARDVTELRRLQDRLWKPLRVDLATGIPNRQAFHEALDDEWRRTGRLHAPLTMAIIDLDSFDAYNEKYGREGGEACLKAVARALQHFSRRAGDAVARFGGKRFGLLLTGGLNHEEGLIIAERIRAEVADLSIEHPTLETTSHVTVSVGVASVVPSVDVGPSILVAAAEDAVAKAKTEGRDRVSGSIVSPIRPGAGRPPPGP
jgi:diguanylate cyclase (GGDEF)-like protein/PAS domain S-box-containing protein